VIVISFTEPASTRHFRVAPAQFRAGFITDMSISSVLTAPARPTESGVERSRYSLVVSSDAEHRMAAQRLRYGVFASEPGFQIPDNGTGLDADRFDEHCDHLLVRDDATDEFVG
jgi:putative hemolysin